jgi:replicative DNA helicase
LVNVAVVTVDVDPEYATVGGLLLAPRFLDQVGGWLHLADFQHGQCGEVYQVLLDLHAAGRPIDAVLVLAELRATGRLDRGGFLARELIRMVEAVPATVMTPHYARLVVADAIYRHVELVGGRVAQVGRSRRDNPAEAFATLDELLAPLRGDRKRWATLTQTAPDSQARATSRGRDREGDADDRRREAPTRVPAR